jgi:hypothetical protein
MIYVMNSAVMPAGCFGSYRYMPATVEDLRAAVSGDHGDWKSSIGYPQNIQLIEKWTGVKIPMNRDETTFQVGDLAIVMRLKRRVVDPSTKGSPVSDSPTDWEFAWVKFNV